MFKMCIEQRGGYLPDINVHNYFGTPYPINLINCLQSILSLERVPRKTLLFTLKSKEKDLVGKRIKISPVIAPVIFYCLG